MTMLAKIVEMLILSPIRISFPCEWGHGASLAQFTRKSTKDSLDTKFCTKLEQKLKQLDLEFAVLQLNMDQQHASIDFTQIK